MMIPTLANIESIPSKLEAIVANDLHFEISDRVDES